jgi:hypothetical protein
LLQLPRNTDAVETPNGLLAILEFHARQLSLRTDAPAKPVRLAFSELFIKQRIGLTDEESGRADQRKCLHAIFP